MKSRPIVLFTALATLSLLLVSADASPQKKKKKAGASPPTIKLESAPVKDTNQQPQPTQQPQPAPAHSESVAKEDPQHAAWRIEVEPYAILGSGRPGKGAADFDKPDGVAFTPNGWLLATDAKNRRVQIWDVKTKTRLGEFGHGVFGGEIVDVAVAPDGMALVTDQTLNLAYAFAPPKPGAVDEKGRPLGPYDYQFKGTRFGEQGFDKLGGIAIDSRGRIYAVDSHLNDVRRFNPNGSVDTSWNFEKSRAAGDTYLHGCEGIAIDEANGNLFIASEKDAVIQVFDWETGKYKGKLIGASADATGKPAGQSVFSGSVEGLAMTGHYLLAVDESAGRIQVFDLGNPKVFGSDLASFAATRRTRNGGYKGFFGHAPMVNFDDKTNKALQQQVKDGAVIPGQANPPGYFCSPDAIASYTGGEGGDTYIAIADQCNYRLAVYRWSDINRAMTPAAVKSSVVAKNAVEAPTGKAQKAGNKKGRKKH
ncbi:MAG: NHL repeat-containing protein [Blastocatellales bacterium]